MLRACSLVLLGAVLILTGCQSRFPSEQIPKMKWLILPFTQPQAMSENPLAVRGWWFGARTIRQNPRGGDMLAEILSHKMGRLDYLNLYSTIDMKYYFANKRQLLKDAYPHLADKELAALIDGVPPLEYAKDLGADKVLSGRILRMYMGENRTIHWWWSTLAVECQVTDVATGKVEKTFQYDLRHQFASLSSMEEEVADRLIKDLEKQYFRPMAHR